MVLLYKRVNVVCCCEITKRLVDTSFSVMHKNEKVSMVNMRYSKTRVKKKEAAATNKHKKFHYLRVTDLTAKMYQVLLA